MTLRRPSPNDLKIDAALTAHAGTLAEAVAAVASERGYKRSAVYGIRRRVELWNKSQAAPKPVIAEGQQLKGVSSYVDADGTILRQWIKTDQRKDDWAALIASAIDRLEHLDPFLYEPSALAPTTQGETTVYPIADWHIGLAAAQTQGWTLVRAAEVYRAAFTRLVASKTPSATALLVFMGDMTHTDNLTNTTPRSGKSLDVTGRYSEVVETAMQLIVDVITIARHTHTRVEVAYLAGNHDQATAVVMQAALRHLYAGHENVTVHPSGHFFYQIVGKTLLGFTHGHTTKRDDLPMIMATDQPVMWGAATYRVWHTGHVHHKTVTEHRGCTVETHSAPTPRDAWHTESGYRSNRAMTSIVYDETGEIARKTVRL